MDRIDEAVQLCSPGDTLLVYFVGHADSLRRRDQYNDVCLALRDTRRDEMWSYLELHHVYDKMREAKATSKILILDCCNCGDAPVLGSNDVLPEPPYLARQLEPQTCVLKALRRDDLAQLAPAEQNGGGQYTAFSGELIDILEHGIPGAHNPLLIEDVYPVLHARLVATYPEPERLTRGSSSITLLENRSADATDIPALSRAQVAQLRDMTPEELADTWTKTGPDPLAVPAAVLKEFLAGFVAVPGGERVRLLGHWLHEREAWAQREELIELILDSPPADLGATARACDRSGCPTCVATADTALKRATSTLTGEALFEFFQAFQGRR
jgi:hypothetical protein